MQLSEVLERGQIKGCTLEGLPQDTKAGATKYVMIGERLSECLKPSGAYVYVVFRKMSQPAWIGSMVPHGPTIFLNSDNERLPGRVQEFIYERACEAHKANLAHPSSYDSHGFFVGPNCAAIRQIQERKATAAELQEIWEYLLKTEHWDRRVKSDKDKLTECFSTGIPSRESPIR